MAEREFKAARRYSGSRVGRSTSQPVRKRASRSDTVGQAFAKSFARQLGTRSGKALVRGIFGTLFSGR
mgnify:FL=1